MLFSFENSSFRDKETGLYNLAYLMDVLFREWHRLIREQDRLSIILIHPETGAAKLCGQKEVADRISNCVYRSTDIISRFNEQDFLIGLFNLNKDATNVIVQRMMTECSQANNQAPVELTASAINLKPSKDIRIEDIFNDLQLLLNDAKLNETSRIKIEEYKLH